MRLKSLIVFGIAVHCSALSCLAENWEPIPASKPLVRLLPQIEELDDDHLATEPVNSPSTSQKRPKQHFPASRFFFRKLTTEATSPSQGFPASAGETETVANPPLAVRPAAGLQPELLAPIPDVGDGHSLSTNLITPQMMGIEEVPSYGGEADCVESTGGVFPKTHKLSTRFRFPGIARLLNQ